MDVPTQNMELSDVLSLPLNSISVQPHKWSQILKAISGDKFQIINLSDLQTNGEPLIIINNGDQVVLPNVEPTNRIDDAPELPASNSSTTHEETTIPTIVSKPVVKTPKRKVTPIKCPLCKKMFDKLSRYHFHMKKHQSPKKYQCKFCTQSYNKEVNYKCHMTVHNTGPPMCPVCDRKFQRIASLKAHLVVHEVEESYSCLHCKAEFEKEEELYRHLDVHEGENIEIPHQDAPLQCNYCNYVFGDVDKYKRHIQLHIQAKKIVNSGKCRLKRKGRTREYAHKCKDCGKSFPKICLLERHQRIHTGEKPFLCTICKRGFSQKSALSIHRKRHEGHKPHECMFCPARFVQKGNLIAHLQKTHTSTEPDEKVYKCTHCTCVFKKISSLNGHVTRVHANGAQDNDDIMTVISQLKELDRQTAPSIQEQLINVPVEQQHAETLETPLMQISYVKIADSSINGVIKTYMIKQRTVNEHRWYLCSSCKKEFKKPSDLIRHIRIHTKEKPYKCPECDLRFAQKSTVNNHLATHRKNEFQCEICKKNFGSMRSLNVHLKKHYPSAVARKTDCYKCSACDKTFDSMEAAKIHMKLHEVPDDSLLLLEKAPEQSQMLQPLIETDQGLCALPPPKSKIPLATLEEYSNRPFKCHVCNAAFGRGAHLRKHMARHCTKKDFTCSVCSKQFVTHSALKEHFMYHKRAKTHSCTECNKAFINASMLQRHIISHRAVWPFICPYCKKRFRAKEHCRKHIARHNISSSTMLVQNSDEYVENVNLNESSIENFSPKDLITFNARTISEELSNVINLPNSNLAAENPSELTVIQDESTVTDIAKDQDIPQIQLQYIYNINDIQLLEQVEDNGLSSEIKLQALQGSESVLLNSMTDLQGATHYGQNIVLGQDGQISINHDTFNPNVFISNYNELDIAPASTHVEEYANSSTITEDHTVQMELNPDGTITDKINDLEMKLMQNNLILENVPIGNEISAKDLNSFNITLRDFLDVRPINLPPEEPEENVQMDALFMCAKCPLEVPHVCPVENTDTLTDTGESSEIQQNTEVDDQLPVDGVVANVEDETQELLSCATCPKKFTDEHRLNRHISAKHKHFIDHTCQYCCKKFKKKSDMDRHIRTHTGEKPFTCSSCDKAFAIKSTLVSHLRTHNPTESKEFQCQVCSSRFSTTKSLKAHMQVHVDKNPFRCELCSKPFKRRQHMIAHMAAHESRPNKTSKMNAVNFLQSFVYETNDKIHEEQQQIVEATEEQIATEHLFSQELTAFGDNMDPVTITLAYNPTLPFKIDDNLVISNASDKTDYFIPGAEYDQVPAKEKKFQCDMCFKYYVSNSVLRKHQRTVHGDYKCDKCSRAFNSMELLEKHYITHDGHRPFSCTLCTNSFSTRASLKVHFKRMHNGVDIDEIVTF